MLANSDLRFSPVFYRTQLEQDAKAYGIPAPSWDAITQPNPYFDELKEKQHLRIKAFYGISPNAVKTQLWIAIATYVLVAILKKHLKTDASLYTILQILSVNIFQTTPILQVLSNMDYKDQPLQESNQLLLFNL